MNENYFDIQRHWQAYNDSTEEILMRLALINEEAAEEMIDIILDERRKFTKDYCDLQYRAKDFIRQINTRTTCKKSVMRN